MQTMDPTTNPALANQIINEVVNSVPETEDYEPDIAPSADNDIILPGGYITALGEMVVDAEVRELTGRDEEIIARTPSFAKTLQAVLKQGTVRVGGEKFNDRMLDTLLAGDRDWLLLNIYTTTFGSDITLTPVCVTCDKRVEVDTDILKITPVKRLDNPYDRNFFVECSIGSVKATLPTAHTQHAMLQAAEKTGAELSTILLQDCIVEMKGLPIMQPSQVLDLSIRDRRTLSEEILSRNIGPQLQDVKVNCPDCDTELEVPLSMAALFQF